MGLLELPIELLALLPQFLYNIEDYTNTSSSCRALRAVCALATPNAILQLAAASSRTFFRPNPHFLIAATARQMSDWALLNHQNTSELRQAFRGGIEALFKFCVAKAGLTMEDIRQLHASRYTSINPVTDMIDKCAGAQWFATPDFWGGGVSDPETIGFDPPRSLMQIVIYGELFHTSMTAAISPNTKLASFDLETRLDFIKYCVPDPMCYAGYKGLEVESIGPYAAHREVIRTYEDDQLRLNHILNCRTWLEAWEKVRLQVGGDFEVEWKQRMWKSAVQLTGLRGLELLRPMAVKERRARLIEVYKAIEKLADADEPIISRYGTRGHMAFSFPSMADEIRVTVSGYWGPWNE